MTDTNEMTDTSAPGREGPRDAAALTRSSTSVSAAEQVLAGWKQDRRALAIRHVQGSQRASRAYGMWAVPWA